MSITPNMGLNLATVSTTTGPLWATLINGAFTTVDSHTHQPGSGVFITPAAININQDLPFNNVNNIIQLRSLRLYQNPSTLSLATDVSCLSSVNGDAYWNSSDGTAVRLTNGHSVVGGTVGNIQGLTTPASATFSFGSGGAGSGNGTFTFLQDTSWYSQMLSGALTIFDSTQASVSNGITLISPTSLENSYSLTFPSGTPASQSSTGILSVSTSGILNYANADNVTLQFISESLSIKSVAGGSINESSVPITALEQANLKVSTTSTGNGTQTITGSTPTAVTNLAVNSFVSTGRPLRIEVVQDGGADAGSWAVTSESGNYSDIIAYMHCAITGPVNSSVTNPVWAGAYMVGLTGSSSYNAPPNSFSFIWTGAVGEPGTYSFQMYACTTAATSTVQAYWLKLMVQELV